MRTQIAKELTVFCCLSLSVAGLYAANYVVPTNLATNYGNVGTSYPCLSYSSSRYQQVYAASEFAAAQNPQLITGIKFRYRSTTSTFYLSQALMEVRLSTTSRTPDGLSAKFADNPGPDETLVFAGTNTIFAGSSSLGKFSLGASFSKPFYYDRTKGNLLLEIRMPGYYRLPNYTLDATDGASDSLSRLYASDTNATSGTLDTTSAITQFTFQDVVISNITSVAPSAAVIKWASITNAQYRLQRSTNLLSAFQDLPSLLLATPPVNTVTDAVSHQTPVFYRIKRER
jgi:hypothetical protein